MCGIAGVAGTDDVVARLCEGILNLEYRGYDSCGVAVLDGQTLAIRKDVGSVSEVSARERFQDLRGATGIAHTRWATHGGVTRENAHPHPSCDGTLAVIHNGVIHNWRALRTRLESAGHAFRSATDTEVVAHLVEEHLRDADLETAFCRAIAEIEGSYAFCLVSANHPGSIYCAKSKSPLVLGLGESMNYVASDFNAFIDFTRRAVVLEDGEYAVVTADDAVVRRISDREVVPTEVIQIAWDSQMAKKGGYPHFMLKEIYEQPQAARAALAADPEKIAAVADAAAKAQNVYLAGVGTTYYVALAGQYSFAALSGRQALAVSTDEFRGVARPGPDDLVLCISQSGETYDTLDALRFTRTTGARTAAVVNVMGSSIARMVDIAIPQSSGPEICVISTKAALAQMIVLMRLAVATGEITGMPSSLGEKTLAALDELPKTIEALINERSGFLNALGRRSAQRANWMFLGRGPYAAIALECALKMKEVAYVHAEGMPAGFLKHGTLALIDDAVTTLVFMPPHAEHNPQDERNLYDLSVSSVEEIRARGGKVVGFVFDDHALELFDESVVLPPTPPEAAPLVSLVAGQLFSYFTAVALGRPVDRPRSLAKSVTVP
jgi:glucosamine--fructose-6-phosphate aminotransferase (isomerizing)